MKRYALGFMACLSMACGAVDDPAAGGPKSPTGKADGADCGDDCAKAWPAPVCTDAGWCWDTGPGFSNRLTDVHILDDGSIVAVGDHGSFLRFAGGAFEVTVSNEPLELRGVVESEDGAIWAVGTRGLIVERAGQGWSKTVSPTERDLAAIWLGPEGELWAAGEDVVLRRDDDGWVVLREGVGMGGVEGVTAPDGQVWIALGDQSWAEILRWDGADFHVEYTGGPADGHPAGVDVAADAEGRIHALLTRATTVVKTRDPKTGEWSVSLDDRQPAEEALLLSADGAVHLGGRSGVRTSSPAGVERDAAAPEGILAIAETPDGALWAVGENGLVARRVDGDWQQFSGLAWTFVVPAVTALARTDEGLWVGRDRAYLLTELGLEPQGPFEERIGYGLALIDFESSGDLLWALYRDDIRDLTEVWLRSDGEWTKSFEAPAMRSLWLSPNGTLWAAGASFIRRTGPNSGERVNEIYRHDDSGWETIPVAKVGSAVPGFSDISGVDDDFVVFSGSVPTAYHGWVKMLYILDEGVLDLAFWEGAESFQCLHVSGRASIHVCNGHRILRYDGETFATEAEFPNVLFPREIAAAGEALVVVGDTALRDGHAGFVATGDDGGWTLQWPGVSDAASIFVEDDGTLRLGAASGAVLSLAP